MSVGPAGVHAKQHARPVAGLCAAGAGVHLQEGLIAVGLAGQQGLEFSPGRPVADGLELGAGLFEGGLVVLFVSHLCIAHGVCQVPLEAGHGFNRGRQSGPFATQRLGLAGTVPERRILDPGVQLMKFTECDIPVKDAS